MKNNACKLCRQSSDLRESHLLPKAFYRLLRRSDLNNEHPIICNQGTARSTSDQVKDYVLCGDCEQRFNRNGESYILKNCYRGKGHFKLRQLLEKQEPSYVLGVSDFGYEPTKIEGFDIDKLVYFASSVFWRASVHQWSSRGQQLARSSLGYQYEEEFRQYLLGRANFPANASLLTWVSKAEEPANVMIFPFTGRMEGGYFWHRFWVRGFMFFLMLGSTIPREVKLMGLPHGNLVLLGDQVDDLILKEGLNLIRESLPFGKLKYSCDIA